MDCSNRGKCENGKCSCQVGYGGEACEKRICPGVDQPCSGHGECNEVTGKCFCKLPWEGRLCNVSNCYNNGIWKANLSKCICLNGYTGKMCELKSCARYPTSEFECSDHGICNHTTGTCECNVGYTGINCEAPFSLLPRKNTTWKNGLRFGGNETIDSFARRFEELESVQLLNMSATIDAHEKNVIVSARKGLNKSDDVKTRSMEVPVNMSEASMSEANMGLVNDVFRPKGDSLSGQSIARAHERRNQFVNANYRTQHSAMAGSFGQHQNQFAKKIEAPFPESFQNGDGASGLRFKDNSLSGEHVSLIAEAIVENDNIRKNAKLNKKSQREGSLLRLQ